MNKLHKKILSLGLVYFTTAASYATAPDWLLGDTFGGAPFPPPAPPQAPSGQKWTSNEDTVLRTLVEQYGTDNWPLIASFIPGRNARQCRERWNHYLAPGLNLSAWTDAEDTLLLQKFNELGPQWAQIKCFFQGKTNVNCKNRWTALQMRKVTQQQQQLAQPPLLPLPTQQFEIVTQELLHVL